jgi:hypothetical protein
VVREVAVRVDPVRAGDHAVVVVVPEVLPPQAVVVERVLVSVRVRHEDEPQLGVLKEVLDLLVVCPPPLDVPEEEAAVDLGADPLASVLGRGVQDGGLAALPLPLLALAEPYGQDLAALVRVAEDLERGELRIVLRDLVHLVADAARLVVRAPDVEAACGLLCRELGLGEALRVLPDLDVVSLGAQGVALSRGENQRQLDGVVAGVIGLDDLVAGLGELGDLGRVGGEDVHLELSTALVLGSSACSRGADERGQHEKHGDNGKDADRALHRTSCVRASGAGKLGDPVGGAGRTVGPMLLAVEAKSQYRRTGLAGG